MIILRTVKNFSSLNIAASILLFLMAILAAVIANSPMAPLYQGFLLQELHLRIGDFNLFSHGGHPLKMIEFINDCLMTVFFLAVGLEINRVQLDECCAGRIRFLPEHCGSDRSLQAVLLPQAVPASDPVQAARPGLPHQRLYYILNPYRHHPCTVFVQMVLILCYLFSVIAL